MASDGDLAALRRQQERLTQWSGQIVIIDLLCMMVLPLERLEVPGTGFVVNDVAVAFLAVLAAFRAPKIKGQHLTWVPILLATAVGILVMSYLLNGTVPYILGLDGRRRIAHLALMSILVISLGTGRIHPRSAVAGLSTGVLLATVLAFFKIGGDAYPGRLSGYFGDPNVAGLILAVLGPVIVGSAKTKPRMVLYGGSSSPASRPPSRAPLPAGGRAGSGVGPSWPRSHALPGVVLPHHRDHAHHQCAPRVVRTAGAFQNRDRQRLAALINSSFSKRRLSIALRGTATVPTRRSRGSVTTSSSTTAPTWQRGPKVAGHSCWSSSGCTSWSSGGWCRFPGSTATCGWRRRSRRSWGWRSISATSS
ncbi:MAG: hypothetical protein IPL93_00655, partial [Actinomycetales bacterium]|nr:hypothetical protein [Actinomycetales bacterium]